MQQSADTNEFSQNGQPIVSTDLSNSRSSDSQRVFQSSITRNCPKSDKIRKKMLQQLNKNTYCQMLFIKEKLQQFLMVILFVITAINLEKQNACVVRMILVQKRDNSNKVLQYFQNQNENELSKGEDNFQSGRITQYRSKSIIKLIESGIFMNQYKYQVLEKTGPSLKFWYNCSTTRFSDECLILIILKSLQGLQILHEANFIHSNLNMASLLTNLEDPNSLFLGNFQEAVSFKPNSITGQKTQHLTKYSSLSQHLGSQLYPKDDLESLLYIVCQLLTNGEFFEKSKTYKKRGEKLKYYFQIKSQFLPEKTFRDLPQCFIEFANKIKYLNPIDQINYDHLRATFRVYKSLQYDWTPIINGYKQQSGTISHQLSQQEDETRTQKKKLEIIEESANEQLLDLNHRLFKNSKSFGDKSEIHPETQESDGELSFEEESAEKSHVYCFK